MEINNSIETHPWPAFIPADALLLLLGTFPPKENRWSMDFFYPNKINDMWRIMGMIFFNNRNYLWDEQAKAFKLDIIKEFLTQKHIALWDTGMKVRRLKDNASDKYLEIVETINLAAMLAENPTIKAVVTAGEKATGVIAGIAGVAVPGVGHSVNCELNGRAFTLYRMPSSSRAYPLAIDKKAQFYKEMFAKEGILSL